MLEKNSWDEKRCRCHNGVSFWKGGFQESIFLNVMDVRFSRFKRERHLLRTFWPDPLFRSTLCGQGQIFSVVQVFPWMVSKQCLELVGRSNSPRPPLRFSLTVNPLYSLTSLKNLSLLVSPPLHLFEAILTVHWPQLSNDNSQNHGNYDLTMIAMKWGFVIQAC